MVAVNPIEKYYMESGCMRMIAVMAKKLTNNEEMAMKLPRRCTTKNGRFIATHFNRRPIQ